MGQGVHDRIHDRGRCAHRRGFSDPLCPDWMVGRRRRRLRSLPLRRLDSGGKQVVHERSAEHVPVLIIVDLLEERGRQAHRQPSMNLSLDDHWIDDRAAVVYRDEPPNLDLAGLFVDVDDADVATERVRQVRWVVVVDRFQTCLHPGWMVRVRREGDLSHRLRLIRYPFHLEFVILPLQVVRAHLEQVCSDLLRLVADLSRRDRGGSARGRSAPARVRAEAVGRGVGVSFLDRDVLGRDPEFLGEDLSIRRLVPLSLRLRAEAGNRLARWMDADLAGIEHLQPEDVERMGGSRADDLCEARDSDPHELAALPLLCLLLPQGVVVDDVHRFSEGALIIAAVVLPAEGRLERERLWRDEVLHAELGRVHAELAREGVHDPFDRERGLRDSERAPVCDPAGRLVRVDAVDFDVRLLERIRSGDDVEQAGGELGRIRRRIRVSVVRDRLHAEGGQLALPRRTDFRGDVVISGERIRLNVLRTVLDPLHWMPGLQGRDDREDVTGIDGDLAPESSTHVRGDDADLLLGQSCDDGEHGSDRVRRLGRHPHGDLPHRVEGRDAASRLDRGHVDPRDVEVLFDNDIGFFQGLVRTFSVPDLPVPDPIRLLLPIRPDNRSTGLEGLHRFDVNWERYGAYLDGGDTVRGRISAVRDDRGDFLRLIHNPLDGQHHLLVGHEGRHPCEVRRLEVLPADHREDARDLQRLLDVDGPDACVRVRTPDDVQIEHPGELHVVDVIPFAPDEAGVLLPLYGLADAAVHGHGRPPPEGPAILFAACWIAFTIFT